MRILAAAPSFPSPSHPYAGIFTAKIVGTLRDLGHAVTVVCPTPFVPPGFGNLGRWKQYANIPKQSEFEGVTIYQPRTVVVPGLFQAFWSDEAAWLSSRTFVKKLHRQKAFEAIIGFDLGGAGGLAWRLGRDLGIPAAGWAYGSETRIDPAKGPGKSVVEAVNKLDLVFYQSSELRDCASTMAGRPLDHEPLRHLVLPHGIRLSDRRAPSANETKSLRTAWGATETDRVILSIGRVRRDKGVFDQLEAFSAVAEAEPRARLVIVGALPPRDDSEELRAAVQRSPLKHRIQVMPALDPTLIPDALNAADIFAFTSYLEGMPNVVLEAMLFERPTVAFDIPPLREADPNGEALAFAAKGDVNELGLRLKSLLINETERANRVKNGTRLVESTFDMRNNLKRAVDALEGLQIRGA
jgi:teichuronic acid biosynthesis glycosyltransferase TuaC